MQHHEREACRLHSKTRGYRNKLVRATEHTYALLDRCAKPYVAFSGGKDSTVCLAIARGINPEFDAILSHDQWLLPETDAFIRTVPGLTVIAGTHTHLGGVVSWGRCRPHDPMIVWVDCPNHAVEHYVLSKGYDGVIIGLRCDESGYRARHIRAKGVLFDRKNGITQSYPIAGWSDMDVWAYLITTGTPYNPAYDRMSELGIPLTERRVGPWWNDRAISGGSIGKLQMGWPDTFNRFKQESQQCQ